MCTPHCPFLSPPPTFLLIASLFPVSYFTFFFLWLNFIEFFLGFLKGLQERDYYLEYGLPITEQNISPPCSNHQLPVDTQGALQSCELHLDSYLSQLFMGPRPKLGYLVLQYFLRVFFWSCQEFLQSVAGLLSNIQIAFDNVTVFLI